MCYNKHMRKKGTVQVFIYLLVAAVLFSCVGCSTGKISSGLVISEVVSSNQFSITSETLGSPDWVEFYNGTNTAINLKGYGFSDNLRNLHKFVFGDVTIPAGGYIVLYLTSADGVEDPDAPIAGFGLSKSGENLFLTDPYYGLVQELTLPALPTDVAYACRADGTYGYALVTTPNAPPDEIADSLSDIYDVSEDGLILSEILPYPNDGEAWVELYNASSEAIRLEDFFLSDNPATAKRYQLRAGTLGAGEYLVCKLNGASEKAADDGSVQVDFRIGANDTAIYLADASGTIIDSLAWDASLATGLAVLPDGKYSAYPTPAAKNSTLTFETPTVLETDGTDPVCINEVLQKNSFTLIDQDGDRSEWVELYNRSSKAVSLKGYFLSDDASAPFRFALPDQTLEAGDYLVVFLSGKDRVQNGEIHASFQLASDETEIYLTNANSFTRDTFALVADCPADVSIGRAADGGMVFYAYPTPWYANATPYSTLDEAYHSVPKVTINEVFPCAVYGDDTPDWIEFKNNTSQEVCLKGWYLSDSLSE
ncbi:MAG: lamin tail domain-containing protein, partial [Eubacteriales bacterium]|nr:lamin tail domain-containing protein [Eubacteriales bacterium]